MGAGGKLFRRGGVKFSSCSLLPYANSFYWFIFPLLALNNLVFSSGYVRSSFPLPITDARRAPICMCMSSGVHFLQQLVISSPASAVSPGLLVLTVDSAGILVVSDSLLTGPGSLYSILDSRGWSAFPTSPLVCCQYISLLVFL